MREFDMLLIPGTGILDDFGQGPLDLPHHLLRWCRAAAQSSVPVSVLSVGAEPVSGAFTRRLFRHAMECSKYRSYRDQESKENAARLGIHVDRDPVYPDLAFSLPENLLPRYRPATWPPKSIGVGVMGYYGWNKEGAEGERIYQAYMAKLRTFIAELLDRGHSVRLLVGDTRADERPFRELADTFSDRSGADGRLIAEPIRTFQDLLLQIAQTDLVVATRLHNVLLALLMERPTISLNYSRKTEVLQETYGLGDFHQGLDGFDVELLVRQFDHLRLLNVSLLGSIRYRNEEFRSRLDEQYDRIFSQFHPRPRPVPVSSAV
jgi:polysaccharide pyruvyl transferase WcaK-like protein